MKFESSKQKMKSMSSSLRTPKDLEPYVWRQIEFLLERKGIGALFVDMGLRKTSGVLHVIKALMHRKQLKKPTLIVSTIKVVKLVWRQEASKWHHTRNFTFSLVHGNQAERLRALGEEADFYLIGAHNIPWLVELLNNKTDVNNWPFGALIVDESDLFKSHNAKRFKRLASVAWLFDHRIIMAGTPTPNSMLDIWAQIYIVDLGRRLGDSFARFRERFFAHKGYKGFTIVPRHGSEEEIYRIVDDVVLRLDKEDWITVPKTHYHTPTYVELPASAMDVYRQHEEEMFFELDGAETEAISAAVLSMQCHQMANGAVYGYDILTGARTWTAVHNAKAYALDALVEKADGPVMIAYWFKHDLARLKRMYPRAVVFGGKNEEEIERQWNAGRIRKLLIHPRSGSHGSNLQFGGRTLIFFSLTWSRGLHDQLVARIGEARAQGEVDIHYIAARHTVDEAILLAWNRKSNTQRSFLNALREYREQTLIRLKRTRSARALDKRT